MDRYSVTETATLAGCTVSYVRRCLREGTIRGEKVGGWLWLIKKSEAEKLRESLGFRSLGKKITKK